MLSTGISNLENANIFCQGLSRRLQCDIHLAFVENAFHRQQRGSDEKVYLPGMLRNAMFQFRQPPVDRITLQQVFFQHLVCPLAELFGNPEQLHFPPALPVRIYSWYASWYLPYWTETVQQSVLASATQSLNTLFPVPTLVSLQSVFGNKSWLSRRTAF